VTVKRMLAFAALAVATAAWASPAQAGVRIGLGIALPIGSPYPYYGYRPYYGYPGYVQPAPVYVQTAPAYPAPAVPTSQGPPSDPADGRAYVEVLVPAGAEVWFNGNPTTQSGEQRDFASSSLTPGREYKYEIRARWTEGGRAVDQTRTVVVRANARVGVDFSQAERVPAPVLVPVPK
jgi:uncharacterized protein (TIGR03000 family)